MGIIQKQGVSNSFLIFLGAAIGALNVLILYPLILPKEYFGLTNVLVQVAFIATQFGLIGAHLSIVKYWNAFKNNFILFSYLLKNTVLFSIIVIAAILFWKSSIIFEYQDKAALFTENYDFLYLMFFFGVVFELFFSTSQANLKTSFPIFLREIFLRLYQTVLLLLYYYGIVSLSYFILFFVLAYGLVAVIVLFYVIFQKSITKPQTKATLSKNNKKEIFSYSIINFLAGFSGSIVVRLDVLMIGALLVNPLIENFSLKAVATYTVGMYVASIIEMPYRGLATIVSPMISRLWNKNNIIEISSIYKKASINLTITSVLLFILLWSNIDDLLFFLPKYQTAKWVIFILGLTKVFSMCLGVNNNIIITSKHYKIGTYTMVMLILITFGFNYFFIPRYGIEGAALGSLISIVIYNLVSFLFLYYKFKLQPFSLNTLKVIVLGAVLFYGVTFIDIKSEIINILVKSLSISSIYIFIVYKLELSSDVNQIIKKMILKVTK